MARQLSIKPGSGKQLQYVQPKNHSKARFISIVLFKVKMIPGKPAFSSKSFPAPSAVPPVADRSEQGAHGQALTGVCHIQGESLLLKYIVKGT